MKTPVNSKTLKQHFTYFWWIYVLIAVLAVLGINLLYTVTAPRVPDDRKIRLIVYGYTDSDKLNGYMESVRLSRLPDMEVMDHEQITPDDMNGASILATRIYALEGDLYILPRENFLTQVDSGLFVPLENDSELMDILEGVELKRGWRTVSSGETHLYGIPMDKLPGLSSYAFANNGFISLSAGSTNPENAMIFLRILCQDMLTDPEAAVPEAETASPAAERPGTP